jgi:hypothetical protein
MRKKSKRVIYTMRKTRRYRKTRHKKHARKTYRRRMRGGGGNLCLSPDVNNKDPIYLQQQSLCRLSAANGQKV